MGEEEHRPQLLGHAYVGEPEPGEQTYRGVGQHDMAGEVEPVAASVRHVHQPEGGGGHETAEGGPEADDGSTLAPGGKRRPRVHDDQGDGHPGQAPASLDHGLVPRADPERQQPRGEQPGQEGGPSERHRAQRPLGHHRCELVEGAQYPHGQSGQHPEMHRADNGISSGIGSHARPNPHQSTATGHETKGRRTEEAQRHRRRRNPSRQPGGAASPRPWCSGSGSPLRRLAGRWPWCGVVGDGRLDLPSAHAIPLA
jgi:hypothetical protein